MKIQESFQPMQVTQPVGDFRMGFELPVTQPVDDSTEVIFKTVRSNIVQSIRAYHAEDLQRMAARLDQHFLYANLAQAHTRQEVMESIGIQFLLPARYGKNFDALYDCITDPIAESGAQTGFVVVLERIPATNKFDREAREQLLDVFRDAADYWADHDVPFRCFYSFL